MQDHVQHWTNQIMSSHRWGKSWQIKTIKYTEKRGHAVKTIYMYVCISTMAVEYIKELNVKTYDKTENGQQP